MKYCNMMKKIPGFLAAAAILISSVSCSGAEVPESSTEVNDSASSSSEAETSAEETQAPEEEKTEQQTESPTEAEKEKTSEKIDYSKLFSDRDKAVEFGEVSADIALNGTAKCIDSSVKIEEGLITITKEGIYRLAGKFDGSVVVDADKGKVQLILDNAEITSSDLPPICGLSSDKIFISLAENSKNKLTDNYFYAVSSQNDVPDACIYSKDSITVNGLGDLEIISANESGIHSKDDVVITGGNITIDSAEDGIKGKDYTAFCGGTVSIKSGQDGIKSTKTDDENFGFVYIESGDITINSEQDGIQAETDLIVADGTINITSGGGAENSTKEHTDEFGGGKGFDKFDFKGGQGDMTPPDGFDGNFPGGMTPPNEGIQPRETENTTTEEQTDSEENYPTKGMKSGRAIIINGGNINIDSADDSLHTSGNIEINGGNTVLSSGDDGIHAEQNVTITSGDVNIKKSYEGIEGLVIKIDGGNIDLVSSDDGLNATDGSTQTGLGTYVNGAKIEINGGELHVNAQGDGLDSNGDLEINGGTVIVDGPTIGANGALDGNAEIIVNGGTLAAIGASGMAEVPGSGSKQYCLAATLDSSQEAGTVIALVDENGSEIVTVTSEKSFDHIVISSPEIAKGKTYTLKVGDTEAGSFTAEEIISYIGENSGFGGFGGFGGGRKPDGDFQIPTNENGEPDFSGRPDGDRQMPTDENGNISIPDKKGGGFGGRRPEGDRPISTNESGEPVIHGENGDIQLTPHIAN